MCNPFKSLLFLPVTFYQTELQLHSHTRTECYFLTVLLEVHFFVHTENDNGHIFIFTDFLNSIYFYLLLLSICTPLCLYLLIIKVTKQSQIENLKCPSVG
jgi:hypothetical protein